MEMDYLKTLTLSQNFAHEGARYKHIICQPVCQTQSGSRAGAPVAMNAVFIARISLGSYAKVIRM